MEKTRGQYDFSQWDVLLTNLQRNNMRPIYILDYSNPLYDGGLSPHTDAGRTAFANWAKAAALHFQGKGVVWEMYNEPNIGFWKPQPNVTAYAELAVAVGKAIKQATPDEIYVGPATSTIDFNFIESVFKAGALQYFDAVSVHPYRSGPPESVSAEWSRLKDLINKYKPAGKNVPVISSEWGYSELYPQNNIVVQSKYLPREMLINLANDVALMIWYDWHDDCTDTKNKECYFGTVTYDYVANRNPVYNQKPDYHAAQTLFTLLKGYTFRQTLTGASASDFALLFNNAGNEIIAAWTSGSNHTITVTASQSGKCYNTVEYMGKHGSQLCAQSTDLHIPVSDSPLYLVGQ